MLSINHNGLFVCNATTRASLEVHGLQMVLGWATFPNRLSLQVKLTKPDKQVSYTILYSTLLFLLARLYEHTYILIV